MKKRKASNVPQSAAEPASNVQSLSDSSKENSTDGEMANEAQSMVQLPAAANVSVMEAGVTKPFKKRRKNQSGSGDERMDVDQPPMPEQAPHLDTGQKEAAPLRSFPVPKQPELPPKFALARQGLGYFIANAEVIDPQTSFITGREPCHEATKREDEETSGRTWNNQVVCK